MFMETTQIDDAKTVAQIQKLLADHGASSVMVEYAGGKVESVSFKFAVHDRQIAFRLPCRWRAVEALLRKSRKAPRRNDTFDSWARRIAWRHILRWVEAQMAMIETGQVKPEEVFLHCSLVQVGGDTKTMFEHISDQHFLALPAPDSEAD